jgi:glycine betaine/choline ABC-type transport system substrate-binding protein
MWGWRRAVGGLLGCRRVGPAILSMLALGCVVAGCGGASAKQPDEVTITVASRGYSEDVLLREIYAQALEAAGFAVKRHKGRRGASISAMLESGKISGYPDYLDTALTEATPLKLAYAPGSPKVAYEEAKREFAKKGLVPFPPASVERKNAVGLLKRTAQERGLKTLADLKGPAEEMTVKGQYYCHTRTDCAGGLERRYGIVFEQFTSIKWGASPSRLYKALKDEDVDAVMLVTTDGRLLGKNWLVLLEDDEHRLPAANVFWMTRQDVIDEAGPGYEKAILAAQKGLNLQVMRELNAKVELEEEPPAKVAAEYLKSIR